MQAGAQHLDSSYISAHYQLKVFDIPMRDGIRLHTLVYLPLDRQQHYPILLNRTCYNASLFGHYAFNGRPSDYLVRDGYIFVFQDVRGRYMSEGAFNNMTPNIPGNDPRNKKDIDESSDTWDTIEWLLAHIKGHNGKVGIFGISYPGFYSSAAIPDAHPALKAVSPQAPVADFYFDDFHHNGAYLESYTAAFPVFGVPKPGRVNAAWYQDQLAPFYEQPHPDAYDFYLRLGPLKQITEQLYPGNNIFWQQVTEHPNYDSFWQRRNILPHLKNVRPAVMVVGGWFDAEDLYGPLNTYKTIERHSPGAANTLVMGPWGHGDWARETQHAVHNHLYFGDSISTYYLRDVELPFFQHYLKDMPVADAPEALMFNTGTKSWERHEQWPDNDQPVLHFYFGLDYTLTRKAPAPGSEYRFSYVSDPAKPVPYRSETEGLAFTPRLYMSDDQRQASRRTDVLSFQTDTLREALTFSGEIMARLKVSMTGSDADFIVKIIDVYPDNTPQNPLNPPNIIMGGYQQLVRAEVFRGRFRNSFERPEAFVPGVPAWVPIRLQDVLHTFKKGHRIMVQVHSTWFPYIDRNPQNYVDNIYKADASDFTKATITLYPESEILVNGRQD
ncbi:CocE/NonD family hydrolase [Niabella terrae]